MGREWLNRVLYSDATLRPPWRLLLFFLVFFFFAIPGLYAVSVLPRHPLEWGSRIAMLVSCLFAAWLLLSRYEARKFGALGFNLQRSATTYVVSGVAIGVLLFGAVGLLLLATSAATFMSDRGTPAEYAGFLLWTLLYFGISAAFEEALFRGYAFQVLVDWIGVWPGVVGAAGLFALLHAYNPNVTSLALLNIFLAGVLLSLAYLRTRSLWFATGLHLGWNWTMSSLFDLPVSGHLLDTPMYTGILAGSRSWSGGAFGPEGGFAGTIVLILGTLWLARTRRLGPDESVRRLEPLVERRLAGSTL